jgi:hypothetical protein
MLSFSRQKFNGGIGFTIMVNGNETRDFAQLPSMGSASTSKMHLTKSTTPTTMIAPRNEVEFCSSFSKGDNSPQSLKAVFLCLSILNVHKFMKVHIIMVELLEQPLGLVSPLRDTANSLNSAAQCFAALRDGYSILSKGITA